MSNPNQNPPQKQLNIKLDEKVGEGTYANFFMITNSPSEFIMDCGRILPGLPDARIYSHACQAVAATSGKEYQQF